ncbi:helix-turn-helix domain-containing protein, partial [Amylibacter sp.]|nr:helix-turn-helix domain-containing protein [Amylibacter sp.]
FSKQKLVDRLFAFDEDVSDNAIEVYVGRLRKHLESTSLNRIHLYQKMQLHLLICLYDQLHARLT